MLTAFINDPGLAWLRIALFLLLVFFGLALAAFGVFAWENADEEHEQVRGSDGTILGAVSVAGRPSTTPLEDRAIDWWRGQ